MRSMRASYADLHGRVADATGTRRNLRVLPYRSRTELARTGSSGTGVPRAEVAAAFPAPLVELDLSRQLIAAPNFTTPLCAITADRCSHN